MILLSPICAKSSSKGSCRSFWITRSLLSSSLDSVLPLARSAIEQVGADLSSLLVLTLAHRWHARSRAR